MCTDCEHHANPDSVTTVEELEPGHDTSDDKYESED